MSETIGRVFRALTGLTESVTGPRRKALTQSRSGTLATQRDAAAEIGSIQWNKPEEA